jgi:N-acetylmuramoyl-L-alanine amidase
MLGSFRRAGRVVCLIAILGVPPSLAQAVDVPMVSHQGRFYVPLSSIATALTATARPINENRRVRMTVGRDVLVMTRDSAQVLYNGKPVTLSAPVVMAGRRWLVPTDFLTKVVPRVAAGGRIVAVPPRRPPADSRSGATAKEAAPAGTAKREVVGVAGPARQVAVGSAEAAPVEPARERGAGAVSRAAPPVARAKVADLRARSYPTYTRVVVEADAPFAYRVEPNGGSLLVRLDGLDVGDPRVATIQDGLVKDARLGRETGRSTLTVSLQQPIEDIRPMTLSSPFRLVLDLPRPASPGPAAPGVPAASADALRHIVLDAGHGGHDSGAIGPTGLMEKDVVLDITRRVARLIRDRLRLKVTLTRDDDTFIPLRDRTSFANRERADLFISIHANAHRDVASEGVETYFLSLEATDNAARQVAERENEVVNLETIASSDRAGGLKALLWDLSQNAFVEESSNLAEVIQDSMSDSLKIPNRGVKQAGFYVLGGAAMPAVLIETGFVTNRSEERQLRRSRYREEIARAIFAGLDAYKQRYDQRMQAGVQPGTR